METFQNHPLAPYTTVKIGGPADTFIITHTTDEFIEVLKRLSEENKFSERSERESIDNVFFRAQSSEVHTEGREHEKKSLSNLTILGNGSNVLISDSGIRGTVVKNQANSIQYLPGDLVKVDSGVQLPFLINDTISHSLSGLEEFAYIPSTIGGAIYGNIHGTNKNNFDKFLESIDIFDLQTKSTRQILPNQLNWDYDYSQFQQNPQWIILSATLKLSPGDSTASKQQVTDIIAKKITTQSMNSLGSVFKNPPNDSAGRVIDQELKLKGYRLGDAQISPLHANFIVNLGSATATDYLAIIKHVQSQAKQKLNLQLESEIKFLGDFE